MKILFVLPGGDTIYGSGRCAVQLARAIGIKFDLLVGKSLIRRTDEDNLRESFGHNLENIYQLWLPNANFYYGRNKGVLIKFAEVHKYLMWLMNKHKFEAIVHENQYDVIHLNSMILAPMVCEHNTMVLHVREVFEGTKWQYKYIEKKLHQVKAVIYINPSTKNVFDNSGVNSVVIQDPFEMLQVAHLNSSEIKKNLGLEQDSVVFSVLGRYEDRNGTEFIVDTFHKTCSTKAILLVVGGISEKDRKRVKQIIGNDRRIRILGEWKEPDAIFAVSDYILRGERFFSGFSRTVYEGLYSGCRVVFPGRKEEAVDSLQYDEFKDRIIFYAPRNADELCKIIDQCAKYPVEQRQYMTNRKEYVSKYMDVVNNICFIHGTK